jgi:hypothetical protein
MVSDENWATRMPTTFCCHEGCICVVNYSLERDAVGTKQGLPLPSDQSNTTIANPKSHLNVYITACVVVAAVDKRTNQVVVRKTTLYEQRFPKSSSFLRHRSIPEEGKNSPRISQRKNKAPILLPMIQVVWKRINWHTLQQIPNIHTSTTMYTVDAPILIGVYLPLICIFHKLCESLFSARYKSRPWFVAHQLHADPFSSVRAQADRSIPVRPFSPCSCTNVVFLGER